jgi:hypothetical protein
MNPLHMTAKIRRMSKRRRKAAMLRRVESFIRNELEDGILGRFVVERSINAFMERYWAAAEFDHVTLANMRLTGDILSVDVTLPPCVGTFKFNSAP